MAVDGQAMPERYEIPAGTLWVLQVLPELVVAALAGNVIVITSTVTAAVSSVDVTNLSKPVFSLMPAPAFSLALYMRTA
jgi:hypothetical protein